MPAWICAEALSASSGFPAFVVPRTAANPLTCRCVVAAELGREREGRRDESEYDRCTGSRFSHGRRLFGRRIIASGSRPFNRSPAGSSALALARGRWVPVAGRRRLAGRGMRRRGVGPLARGLPARRGDGAGPARRGRRCRRGHHHPFRSRAAPRHHRSRPDTARVRPRERDGPRGAGDLCGRPHPHPDSGASARRGGERHRHVVPRSGIRGRRRPRARRMVRAILDPGAPRAGDLHGGPAPLDAAAGGHAVARLRRGGFRSRSRRRPGPRHRERGHRRPGRVPEPRPGRVRLYRRALPAGTAGQPFRGRRLRPRRQHGPRGGEHRRRHGVDPARTRRRQLRPRAGGRGGRDAAGHRRARRRRGCRRRHRRPRISARTTSRSW